MAIASVPYQSIDLIIWYGTEGMATPKQVKQHRTKKLRREEKSRALNNLGEASLTDLRLQCEVSTKDHWVIISTFHIGWIIAEEKEREIQTSVCSVY